MLGVAIALEEVRNDLWNPDLKGWQKIDVLERIATGGVRPKTLAEAQDLVNALEALAMDQKDPQVEYYALAALEKVKEQEEKLRPPKLNDKLNDNNPPKPSARDADDDADPGSDNDDDGPDPYAAALTSRKRSLAAVLLTIAKTKPEPEARAQQLESYMDSAFKNGGISPSAEKTLTFIANNDTHPAVQSAISRIMDKIEAHPTRHVEGSHPTAPKDDLK